MATAIHVIRGSGGINAVFMLEGKLNDVRVQRGRPLRNWLDDVEERTDLRDYSEIKRSAEDRNY